MLDIDTFLTALYTHVDDFCRTHLQPEEVAPGPPPLLNRSEVITLSIFGQQGRFASERDFWRFVTQRLTELFKNLPDRSQFVRLQRRHQAAALSFGLHLGEQLCLPENLGVPAYEAMDRCGLTTRWRSRRGAGWMPEHTDKGLCSRLGWFVGLHLLTCVTRDGVISGFGLGPASAKDQPMAEAFLFARHHKDSRLPSAGRSLSDGDYIADKGFNGRELHERWLREYQARVTCPPQRHSTDKKTGKVRWPKSWHTMAASWRQIVETVHDKLLNFCRLNKDRPHDLSGFSARLAAKVALHNFCIFLNHFMGRHLLAFVDLIGW